MNTTKRKLFLITILGVAALTPPASAQSVAPQDSLPTVQVTGNSVLVTYADLAVGSAEGMVELHRRLNAATVSVCRFHRGRLQDPAIENDCRHVAKERAMVQFERNETQRFTATADRVQLAQIRITAPTGS